MPRSILLLAVLAFDRLELTMERVEGSFGVELAHYAAMHNVVQEARAGGVLQAKDILAEINGITLIDQRIDSHLPAADSASVVCYERSGSVPTVKAKALYKVQTRLVRACFLDCDGAVLTYLVDSCCNQRADGFIVVC